MSIRITTWNVNGIRNPFGYHPWRDKRTFEAMFDILEADIIVMQELKIQRKDLRDDMVLVHGWDCYFSLPRQKKGYSGVAIYTRQSSCAPTHAEEGLLGVLCPPGSTVPYCEMPDDQCIGGYLSASQLAVLNIDAAGLDAEGRCVVLEFPAFVIFGIYSPANSTGLRDDFRHDFQLALDTRVRNLIKSGKRVVVCGDLNVSREEMDTANAEEMKRKEGITHRDYVSTPNRRIFNQLLEGGVVFDERDKGREQPVLWDVCRGFHPNRQGMFTHWEQKINARPGNFGSRIDFVLCSLDMKTWFVESDIQEGLMGSDHCPVYAVVKDKVIVSNQARALADLMSPRGTFENGLRIKSYDTLTRPCFSARLMPEFRQRRSIRDMFEKKSTDTTPSIPAIAEADDFVSSSSYSGETELSQTASETQAQHGNNSPERKHSSTSVSPAKPNKKAKTDNRGFSKGQKSLRGFFKPKLSDIPPISDALLSREERSQPFFQDQAPGNERVRLSGSKQKMAMNADLNEEPIIDPEMSKDSWSKLFTKPTAPRCEHGEPCKIMRTKKPGFNCGRDFWMCQRPLGPSGGKEKNTEWRCSTFIWSSDWSGA